jgi:hypothetical protein
VNQQLRKRAIQLFFLLFFCYAFVHQNMGWNQNSRLDLLHAMFVQRTLQIDEYHENTGDKSVHDGHFFSDKAPGIVLIAIPAFAVSVWVLHALDIPLDSPRGWLASSWIATAGSVGLITALGMVALFLLLCRFIEPTHAFVTALVVSLGAAPFPYTTMLFSHAAVAGLISIALWAIADDFAPTVVHSQLGMRSPVTKHILAGFCCGLAIASEYTAAVAAAGVLALAISHRFKNGIIVASAALLPLSLIPTYNWLCFGGPFSFGYHHLALPEFQEMNKGLFGITLPPKPSAAYLFLFSPQRGLFFWTPFFFMIFPGLWRCQKKSSRLFWVSVSVILLQVVFISGYFMPGGGSSLGPRHLAPIIPFVGLAAGWGLQHFPPLGHLLGYYSVLLTSLGTIIDSMPPDTVKNPLVEFYMPKMQRGEFTQNLGQYVGIPPFVAGTLLVFCILALYFVWTRRGTISPGSPDRSGSRAGQAVA